MVLAKHKSKWLNRSFGLRMTNVQCKIFTIIIIIIRKWTQNNCKLHTKLISRCGTDIHTPVWDVTVSDINEFIWPSVYVSNASLYGIKDWNNFVINNIMETGNIVWIMVSCCYNILGTRFLSAFRCHHQSMHISNRHEIFEYRRKK